MPSITNYVLGPWILLFYSAIFILILGLICSLVESISRYYNIDMNIKKYNIDDHIKKYNIPSYNKVLRQIRGLSRNSPKELYIPNIGINFDGYIKGNIFRAMLILEDLSPGFLKEEYNDICHNWNPENREAICEKLANNVLNSNCPALKRFNVL